MNALSEALRGARRVVFFGGAGVSVPSGIPDFRGENGLYAREYDGLTAEMLLSHSFFCLHPDIFYDFYQKAHGASGSQAERRSHQAGRDGTRGQG